MEELTRKVDDLENRSRRFNLRLVGLLEGEEGPDMCAFLETMIPEVFGEFPKPLLIERAHRVGRPPDPQQTPCASEGDCYEIFELC